MCICVVYFKYIFFLTFLLSIYFVNSCFFFVVTKKSLSMCGCCSCCCCCCVNEIYELAAHTYTNTHATQAFIVQLSCEIES